MRTQSGRSLILSTPTAFSSNDSDSEESAIKVNRWVFGYLGFLLLESAIKESQCKTPFYTGEGFFLGEARCEETFKKGIKWLTGFENKLDFWNDKRTSFGPLRSIIQGPLSRKVANLKIRDVVDFTSRWDWSSIQMIFLDEVLRDIMATPIPSSARVEDRLA